jgi:crotonobetainyl-CoA:carnitine CoA-transferase CaiB-like acyl-CoA transferase
MRAYRPLRGVRVLTFEAAFSLPSGTRTLAELGAEVVQVGRPGQGDFGFIAWVDGAVLNKALVSLDLKCEEGVAVARRLALAADVVCNNFRPGVMKRYGLDYASLAAEKPGMIVLQLSGYGGPGPWEEFGAFGPSAEAVGGLWTATGRDGDPPMQAGSGVFADQLGGRYAAFAVLAALARRARTGEGQMLDLSMAESIALHLGERMLRAARDSAPPARTGNRAEEIAPQGIYPCKDEGGRTTGKDEGGRMKDEIAERDDLHPSSFRLHPSDQWVALSVLTTEQWRALRDLVADPLLADPALEDVAARRRRHDEIDAAIGAWARRHTKEEAATLLQERRIPAGPVQRVSDLPHDPQYRSRGSFQTMRHPRPMMGYAAHPHLTLAWQVEGRRRPIPAASDGPGADNRRILKRWLGMSAGEVRRLERSGALLPPRPLTLAAPAAPAFEGARIDPAFAERLGLPAAEGETP